MHKMLNYIVIKLTIYGKVKVTKYIRRFFKWQMYRKQKHDFI